MARGDEAVNSGTRSDEIVKRIRGKPSAAVTRETSYENIILLFPPKRNFVPGLLMRFRIKLRERCAYAPRALNSTPPSPFVGRFFSYAFFSPLNNVPVKYTVQFCRVRLRQPTDGDVPPSVSYPPDTVSFASLRRATRDTCHAGNVYGTKRDAENVLGDVNYYRTRGG